MTPNKKITSTKTTIGLGRRKRSVKKRMTGLSKNESIKAIKSDDLIQQKHTNDASTIPLTLLLFFVQKISYWMSEFWRVPRQ